MFSLVLVAVSLAEGQVLCEKGFAARLRSFGNTGGEEIYLGAGDLGNSNARTAQEFTWDTNGATYNYTFTFDEPGDELTFALDKVSGAGGGTASASVSYPSAAAHLAQYSECTLSGLDRAKVQITNRDTGTTVDLTASSQITPVAGVDTLPQRAGLVGFHEFDVVPGRPYGQGFTFRGQLFIDGSFGNSQELSRHELKVCCDPEPQCDCLGEAGAVAFVLQQSCTVDGTSLVRLQLTVEDNRSQACRAENLMVTITFPSRNVVGSTKDAPSDSVCQVTAWGELQCVYPPDLVQEFITVELEEASAFILDELLVHVCEAQSGATCQGSTATDNNVLEPCGPQCGTCGDGTCYQHGPGVCEGGMCVGTGESCTSNLDCFCGCTGEAPNHHGPHLTIDACDVPCNVDSDCPDPAPQNACLQRDCWAGACMDMAAVQCDDFDQCTSDACETVGGEAVCVHEPIAGCCHQADDCPQGNPCERATCDNWDVETGRGVCGLQDKGESCCVSDDNCTVPWNPCLQGVCQGDNKCSELVERDCAGELGPNNDRCKVPTCDGNDGSCYFVTLSDDFCPGACCLPGGVCEDDDMTCRMFCEEDGGTFIGVNTTCQPDLCATNAPTASPTARPTPRPSPAPTPSPTLHPTPRPTPSPSPSPTPAPTPQPTAAPTPKPTGMPTARPTPQPTFSPTQFPTPAPTFQCAIDDDCPGDPATKCNRPVCNPKLRQCGFQPVICNAPDLCTTATCQPDTGLCAYERDYSCCETAEPADDQCHHPGSPCLVSVCVEEDPGSAVGMCALQSVPDCCENNGDCAGAGDPCEHAVCDHHTNSCSAYPIQCPSDLDGDLFCTEPACHPGTGQCVEEPVNGNRKCPGACCLGGGACNVTGNAFACEDALGTWVDSGVSCDVETCTGQ